MCSRKTISDNLTERPWLFFQAVYAYLLQTYQALLVQHVEATYLDWLKQMVVLDATVIRVANRLIQTFPAIRTGKQARWAALKVHVDLWVCRGIPEVVNLTPQKVHETRVAGLRPEGEDVLYLFDLGYWAFTRFGQIIERGQHFISRLKGDSHPLILEVYQGEAEWVGHRLHEVTLSGAEIDLVVNLTGPYRQSRKLKPNVRLVGQRVDDQWHLYITSILDRESYSVALIAQLYALRWQVEIVQSQMTKANEGSRRRGREDVADLDLTIGDNNTVN